MIDSIRLINWRSHSDTSLKFTSGTNLIVGIMGSGKSSVMDGLSFVLFGTFPSIESRKLKITDLFRNDSKEMGIELEINWKGEKYKIVRKVEKKKDKHVADAWVYRSEKLVEKGTRAASEYVEQLLGIDYSLFTRAIYSEQNSIDYFLNLNPKKRKEELDNLLGLDKFEKVRANATKLLNRLKNRKKGLEQGFDLKHLDSIRKRLVEQEKELGAKEQEILEIENVIKVKKPLLLDKKKEIGELKSLKEKFEILEKEEVKIKTKISTYNLELEEIGEIKEVDEKVIGELEERIKTLERSLEEQEKEYLKLSKKIIIFEQSKKRRGLLEKQLNDIKVEDSLENIGKEREEVERIIVKKKGDNRSLEIQIDQISKLIKNSNQIEGMCDFCGTELGSDKKEHLIREKERLKGEKNKERAVLEKEIEQSQERFNRLKKDFERIEKEIRKVEMIREELQSIKFNSEEFEHSKERIEKVKEEIKNGKMETTKEKERLRELKAEIKKFERLQTIKQYVKKSQERLLEIENEKKELEFDNKKLDSLQEEINRLLVEGERLFNQKTNLKKEQEYIGGEIENIKKEILRFEKISKNINKVSKYLEELTIFSSVLLEIQISLRDRLIGSINRAMNEIWDIFYPYKDFEKLRINITQKDYRFEIFRNEEWRTLESVASGGERACCALALRVALSSVLTPNLSIIVLDEPTHNLDRQTVQLLSDTLQYKITGIVSQIFIITHEELLCGANFATSYRLKRNKEIGEATQVEVL